MANIITSNYTYYSNPTQVKSGEFWYDDSKSSTITMDSFLSLMIAELANQDFNNATDTSEFTQQLAVYAQVEAMNQMVEYSQINYASNLIGKDVAVLDSTTQQIKYGAVNALNMMNGELEVFVDGVTYSIDDVVQVYPVEEKTTETNYDTLVKKLLDGLASLKSDANSSLTSSFTSALEKLLDAIEELLEESKAEVDEEVIEDVESTEEVETESTTETPVVDTTEEAAQENASSVASEELNTTL